MPASFTILPCPDALSATIPPMRRLVVFLVMLIVPLQFAWAAAAGVHGHVGKDIAAAGFHTHDHEHHDVAPHEHGGSGTSNTQDHNEDGHHGHAHPVFTPILTGTGFTLEIVLPGGPILHPPAAFASRTPPLLDRPPLAHA